MVVDTERRRASRFLILALALLVVVAFFILRPFLTGALFALTIGFLLQRPYHALLRRVKRKPIAGGLLVLLVLVVLVAPLAFLGWELVREARALSANVEAGAILPSLVAALRGLGVSEPAARDALTQAMASAGEVLKNAAVPTLSVIASFLVNLGVFVFLLYFVLAEGDSMLAFVRRAMPLQPVRRDLFLATIGERVRALFLGTFVVSLVQGTVSTLAWWLLGFPHPIFWGLVMTVLAILPAVGPTLVMVPAGLFAIATGNVFAGVAIIVFGVALVPVVDNVTRAYIVGRSADVHPALVLLGTLGGLALFGAVGFVLGPLLLSLVGPVMDEWEAIRSTPEVPS